MECHESSWSDCKHVYLSNSHFAVVKGVGPKLRSRTPGYTTRCKIWALDWQT
jgi:hypothetical protein